MANAVTLGRAGAVLSNCVAAARFAFRSFSEMSAFDNAFVGIPPPLLLSMKRQHDFCLRGRAERYIAILLIQRLFARVLGGVKEKARLGLKRSPARRQKARNVVDDPFAALPLRKPARIEQLIEQTYMMVRQARAFGVYPQGEGTHLNPTSVRRQHFPA
jgi:hypothetical protein